MKKVFTRAAALFIALLGAVMLTACDSATAQQIAGEISNEFSKYVSEEFDFGGDGTSPIKTTEPAAETESAVTTETTAAVIDKDGAYTSKDDVALYIHTYGTLPSNFITKAEAKALGWTGGSLEPYAPGKSIGGDRFGNYEGALPEAAGRVYTECDIDTMGAEKRGAKRIVFSNDGLIYYTDDHYETFLLLYGEE